MFSGPRRAFNPAKAHWCSTTSEKVTALNLRTGNELWSRKYNPEIFFQYDTEIPFWEDIGQPFAGRKERDLSSAGMQTQISRERQPSRPRGPFSIK